MGQIVHQQLFSLFTRIIPRPYRDCPHTICVMLRSRLPLFVDMFQYRSGSLRSAERFLPLRIDRQSSFLTSPGANCARWGYLSSARWNLPTKRSNCSDTFRLWLIGLAQTAHRTSPVFPCPPHIPASHAAKSYPDESWMQQYNLHRNRISQLVPLRFCHV